MHKKINEFLTKNLNLNLYWRIRHYWAYLKNRNALKRILKENPNQKQMQFPSKIAIFFLGTNDYINYFPRYYQGIKKLFLTKTPKDFFVFTNQIKEDFLNPKDIQVIKIEHERYPMLKRFEYIRKAEKKFKKYDFVICIDADMLVNELISEKDFFSHDKPLIGVRHPNFAKGGGNFETNPNSLAGVKKNEDLSVYIQACLFGGRPPEFFKFIKEVEERIDIDFKNNVIAKLQDESHLNKYFIRHKNLFHIYNPSYAYPERPIPKPFRKKMIHAPVSDISKKMIKGKFL